MKKFHKIVCIATASVLSLTGMSALTACKQKGDPETRPFVMAIQTPDGVFNPFFSSSQYDSNILSWTQVSMFSTTPAGEIACGENEPSVVLDYAENYDRFEDNGVDETGVTTYELAIKNGIKFSDGVELTIKDVLFNLYAYLDPAYTGSSTIYSTNILGLNAYRTGKADASDTYASEFENRFANAANERIDLLIDYVYDNSSSTSKDDRPGNTYTAAQTAQAKADYATVRDEFRRELETDWNTATTQLDDYSKNYGFTDVWQIFMLNDGGWTNELLEERPGGGILRDEQGNFHLDAKKAADWQTEIDTELGDKKNDPAAVKEWAINNVHESYFPVRNTVEQAISATYAADFASILYGWMTGDTIRTNFTADEKSKYFETATREVLTISGVTTKKASVIGTGSNQKNLGQQCDVLQIKIRGVDPKAIWNFGFVVAPMHYYSGVYEGKNYVTAFDADKGEFGLKYGSAAFMTEVVNAPNKIGLPVGAGAYKASSRAGTPAKSGEDFFGDQQSRVFYERNEYFTTLGKGIENAKIKYMQYRVVASEQLVSSVIQGEVDYAEPSATPENKDELKSGGIGVEEALTSGYGYIGINPRYVPNINVRRAIIKAMNTQLIIDNYYKGMASLISRSMTRASWAYPETATTYTAPNGISYAADKVGNEIKAIVEAEGYTLNGDGVYSKTIPGYGEDVLDYTFTIAGGSTDHPAYNVFIKAREILNRNGWNVKVAQSATALSDLTTGKLEVWAAAWSSTIDPDLYQVYHMDSKATSINNWGYPQIKANTTLYSEEWGIIQKLSGKIDDARSTTDQPTRKKIYADALELIMELAVELPTYQRNDLFAFNQDLLDRKTMPASDELGPYNALLARIWEVNYK